MAPKAAKAKAKASVAKANASAKAKAAAGLVATSGALVGHMAQRFRNLMKYRASDECKKATLQYIHIGDYSTGTGKGQSLGSASPWAESNY